MTDRLRPYEGTGPFTFVSYAHKDKGAAEQIIAALTQNGVNTWYDLGIAPGTIWRNELAEKIQGCQTFLFLQSAQSLQSENCQSEISYALEQKKKVVVVRLDRTELPGGMALAIGERQAIEKFDLPEQDFYEILLKALAPGEKTPIVRQPGKTVSLFGYHLQRTPAYVGLGTLAAILVGATAYFVMPSTTQPSNQETPAVHAPTHGTEANWSALAVLPFANLSGDPEKDILSDGISVELMKVIGENTDLKIAARTSSFVFKDSALDAREIGEALGVDGLLEGSVRWFGDRIDVDVQLIDANTGFQVWSDSYQRDSVDYFKVQQEIAYAVASRVNSRISARTQASQAANTLSLQSWEKYLAALDLMQNDTRETYLRASEIFADIIETNPDFSAAYSSKANALLLAQGHRAADEIQRLVDKALALDPANAEAMAAQVGLYNSQSKYSEAEAALTKAEALMSNSVTLNFAAVYTYAPQGDYKTALIHARKAYEMDPFSPIALRLMADVLSMLGRYDEAEDVLDRQLYIQNTPQIKQWNNFVRFFMYWNNIELDRTIEIYQQMKLEIPDAQEFAVIRSDLLWSLGQMECEDPSIVGYFTTIECLVMVGKTETAESLLQSEEFNLRGNIAKTILRGQLATRKGDFEAANAEFEKLPFEEFFGNSINQRVAPWYVWSLRGAGEFEKADQISQNIRQYFDRLKASGVMPANYLRTEVQLLAIEGSNQEAIDLIEKHYQIARFYPWFRTGIIEAFLKEESRYQDLKARMEKDLDATYAELKDIL